MIRDLMIGGASVEDALTLSPCLARHAHILAWSSWRRAIRPTRVKRISGENCNCNASLAAAGSNLGSLDGSARTIMAQAMRVILLASATAATWPARPGLVDRADSSGLSFVKHLFVGHYRPAGSVLASRYPTSYRLPRLQAGARNAALCDRLACCRLLSFLAE
jgi:hypothetical protein